MRKKYLLLVIIALFSFGIINTYAEGNEHTFGDGDIEIYEYVEAYGRLIFSVDGSKVYNPSALKLYFQAGSQVVCVKPGETISLG